MEKIVSEIRHHSNGERLRLSSLARTSSRLSGKGRSEKTETQTSHPYRVPGPLPVATHRLPVYTLRYRAWANSRWPSILGTPLTHSRPHGKLPSPLADKVEKTSLAAQHLSANLTLFITLVYNPRFAKFWRTSMNCPSPVETYPLRFSYTSSRPEVSGWPNIPPNLPTSPSFS